MLYTTQPFRGNVHVVMMQVGGAETNTGQLAGDGAGDANMKGKKGSAKNTKRRSTKKSSKSKSGKERKVSYVSSGEIAGSGIGHDVTCAYSSTNGNCKGTRFAESSYCTAHTCPQCYGEKTSREDYCRQCTDAWNSM